MAPNGTLTPTQERAAVGLAAGATQEQAAALAGCGRRSVARWWAEDDGFRVLVARLRAEHLEAATGTLTAAGQDAAARLVALAVEPSSIAPRDRLAACRLVLTLGRDLHHAADLDRRLVALEQLVNERTQHGSP